MKDFNLVCCSAEFLRDEALLLGLVTHEDVGEGDFRWVGSISFRAVAGSIIELDSYRDIGGPLAKEVSYDLSSLI